MNDTQISDALERVSVLLELRGENPLRVEAYHRAAELLALRPSMGAPHRAAVIDELVELPYGLEVEEAIAEWESSGMLELLDELESAPGPRDVLQRIPGVGPVLAARMHDRLGVETLKELERAASDGRLDAVAGIARGKAEAIREELQAILRDPAQNLGMSDELPPPPPIELLLELDIEYRHRAASGELLRVVPRRFNPHQERWLSVMQRDSGPWRFTVAYSNSRRAHEERGLHDWVTIWFATDGTEDSSTVFTAKSAALRGQRIIRGRENECRRLYLGRISSTHAQGAS